MKFWFCEKCGKRLTEADLAEGQGRDKKLKGVFCSQCSVGVMTMETLPLSETEARKLLGKPDPHSATPAPKRGTGRREGDPAVRPRPHPEHATHPQGPPPTSGAKRLIIALAVACGCAGLIMLLLATKQGPAPMAAKDSLSAPAPKVEAKPAKALASAPKNEPASQVLEQAPPAPTPGAPEQPMLSGPAEGAQTVVAPVVEADPASTPSSTTPPPAPVLPENPPPPPADPAAEAAAGYMVFTDEFLDLLRKRDKRGAEVRLDRAEKDPVLRPLAESLGRDRRMLNWLGDLESAFLKGVEKLKEVDEFELNGAKGEPLRVGRRAAYQVLEVKPDGLEIGAKGMSFALPLSKLTPETSAKLEQLGLGDDGAGLLRKAFASLLKPRQAKGAESNEDAKAALQRARKAGASAEDIEYLLAKLDAFTRGAREEFAERELAKFDRHFAAREWAQAERAGAKLLAEFGASTAVKARPGLGEQVATAARNGAPIVEYTLTFQEGAAIPELGLAQYHGVREANLYKVRANEDNHTEVGPDLIGADGGKHLVLIGFALFDYETGPLPASAEILEAKLQLYSVNNSGFFEFRQILSKWIPSEVAWNFAMKGKPWKQPGGEVAEAPAARVAKTEPWFEADLSESLRAMHKEKKNFGWQLDFFMNSAGARYNSMTRLNSSRNRDPSTRPKLVLKVRCPRFVITPRKTP